ncbi:hypothetical protein HYH03_010462 [Edaphochlamys debaryana]|uniref:Uncharacterized protein n=1 Tax=Edaphochlamys debaryana TaxID=47281 RepID=A0A835Y2A3_9CHLO|nr:hypothetical protein HYH03_010462 [Edaphochlamys debaryana]|eukprot:KAG2491255.1 hypothetical protein HYH03_010462 [Edaphochlamys debaryana]
MAEFVDKAYFDSKLAELDSKIPQAIQQAVQQAFTANAEALAAAAEAAVAAAEAAAAAALAAAEAAPAAAEAVEAAAAAVEAAAPAAAAAEAAAAASESKLLIGPRGPWRQPGLPRWFSRFPTQMPLRFPTTASGRTSKLRLGAVGLGPGSTKDRTAGGGRLRQLGRGHTRRLAAAPDAAAKVRSACTAAPASAAACFLYARPSRTAVAAVLRWAMAGRVEAALGRIGGWLYGAVLTAVLAVLLPTAVWGWALLPQLLYDISKGLGQAADGYKAVHQPSGLRRAHARRTVRLREGGPSKQRYMHMQGRKKLRREQAAAAAAAGMANEAAVYGLV